MLTIRDEKCIFRNEFKNILGWETSKNLWPCLDMDHFLCQQANQVSVKSSNDLQIVQFWIKLWIPASPVSIFGSDLWCVGSKIIMDTVSDNGDDDIMHKHSNKKHFQINFAGRKSAIEWLILLNQYYTYLWSTINVNLSASGYECNFY